jgi:hypothetical protein
VGDYIQLVCCYGQQPRWKFQTLLASVYTQAAEAYKGEIIFSKLEYAYFPSSAVLHISLPLVFI